MNAHGLRIPRGRGQAREDMLEDFADKLESINRQVGFKVSSRGWCYMLESPELGALIDKSQFNLVEDVINECRKKGYLDIDFTAEEEGRKFSGVETPTSSSPEQYIKEYLDAVLDCDGWFTPDWWDGEEYYIQVIVEKIDLKTLFKMVTSKYHIPIATSKGWSSMLQRAEYAKRFKLAEERGMKCVLLYCGDHDPDGLRISEFLRKGLEDLEYITWGDGTGGYDPGDLIIERFGLNRGFIDDNSLSWIDNLITGSGRDLASTSHKNHYLPYVQHYLEYHGARKCEANALVVRPDAGRDLVEQAILRYLGKESTSRFRAKRQAIRDRMNEFRDRTGVAQAVKDALKLIEDEYENGEDEDDYEDEEEDDGEDEG